MTTLLELRTDVRSHVDEQTAIFWEDTELDRWINEGLREVARRSETLQKQRSYTVENGKEAYPLPDDMLRIYRVEYKRTTDHIMPLEFRPFNEMDSVWGYSRTRTGGSPEFYSIWSYPGSGGQGLYVTPVPSETLSDGLRVFYYALPKQVVEDEDVAEIPAGWEDLIPLYVEYTARRKEASDNRWQEAKGLFEERLKEMLKTTRNWSDQQNFMVGDNFSYLSEDW